MDSDLASVFEKIKRASLPGFEEIPTNDPNFKGNSFGETPLHIVAIWGDVESARILLDAGAEIDPPGEFAFTPLLEAISQGHLEMVRLLVSRGADLQIKNEWGDDALSLAMMMHASNEEMIRIIRSK